jgi:hypothetical protein
MADAQAGMHNNAVGAVSDRANYFVQRIAKSSRPRAVGSSDRTIL